MRNWLKILLFVFSSFKMAAQSDGGITSGEVCFRDSVLNGFITLNSYVGNILYWETSTDNGVTWINQPNIISQFSYSNVNQTTWYRAIVQNPPFPQDTSTISKVVIYNKFNIIGGGAFCLTAPSSTLQLGGQVSDVFKWEFSTNGGSSWTTVTNTLTTLTYPNITQNTLYRAISQHLSICPIDTSLNASFIISQNTITGTLLKNDTVCNGLNSDTINISGNLGNIVDWIQSTNNAASWTPTGSSLSTYTYSNITQTTLFAAIVKNGVCPSDTTLPVKIVVVNASTVSAGSDKSITQYESIQLDGAGDGIPVWSPNVELSNQSVFNPIASPLQSITYVLTLTDKNSCISTDSVNVEVIIPVPNAITPNDDGVNDYFLVTKSEDFNQSSLLVFNRWGNLVFKDSPYKNNWNGKSNKGQDLPDEVYYYIFDYGNGEKPLSGYILIKR